MRLTAHSQIRGRSATCALADPSLWHDVGCLGDRMFAMNSLGYRVKLDDTMLNYGRSYAEDVLGQDNRFRVDEVDLSANQYFTFEWNDTSSPSSFIRAYACLTFIRQLEENPNAVSEYLRLREFMPSDAALILSGHSDPTCSWAPDGHGFAPAFNGLRYVGGLTLDACFFSKLPTRAGDADGHIWLHDLVITEPWWHMASAGPLPKFSFTKEIYEYMLTTQSLPAIAVHAKIIDMIPFSKIKYEPVALSDI